MFKEYFESDLHIGNEFAYFVNHSPAFEQERAAHFVFLNEENGQILYSYSLPAGERFDEQLLEEFEGAPVFLQGGNLQYRRVAQREGEEGETGEKSKERTGWLGIALVEAPEKARKAIFFLELPLAEFSGSAPGMYLNEGYLEQLLSNVHQMLMAYENVFPTIDMYVELFLNKDREMAEHMTNVTAVCLEMATRTDLSGFQKLILLIAGLTHDIGKLYIPDHIINKTEKLTEEEFSTIKLHANKSGELFRVMFSKVEMLAGIPEIIEAHHENYDGTGYPRGLSGEEIPRLARVLRLADSIDAMAAERPYKTAFSKERIVKEIEAGAGSLYDPEFAKIAIDVLREEMKDEEKDGYFENFYSANAIINVRDGRGHEKSLDGTVWVTGATGKFLVLKETSEEEFEKERLLSRCSICLGMRKALYEFSADIVAYDGRMYILENLTRLAADRYYSMPWSSEIKVLYGEGKYFPAKMINFGVEGISFTVKNLYAPLLEKLKDEALVVLLEEKVSEVSLTLKAELVIQRSYEGFSHSVLVCTYKALGATDREDIFKLLFKKQMERRSRKYQN